MDKLSILHVYRDDLGILAIWATVCLFRVRKVRFVPRQALVSDDHELVPLLLSSTQSIPLAVEVRLPGCIFFYPFVTTEDLGVLQVQIVEHCIVENIYPVLDLDRVLGVEFLGAVPVVPPMLLLRIEKLLLLLDSHISARFQVAHRKLKVFDIYLFPLTIRVLLLV